MSPIRDDDRPKGTNWKPWVLGCVGVPLLLIVGCIALMGGAFFWARNSVPNKSAVERARQNPAVIEALGTPIKAGLSGSTQFSTNATREGNVTQATLVIPVTGPKGRGRIEVVGQKRKGRWHYSQLEAVIDKTGQRIDLRTPEEASEPTPPAERDR